MCTLTYCLTYRAIKFGATRHDRDKIFKGWPTQQRGRCYKGSLHWDYFVVIEDMRSTSVLLSSLFIIIIIIYLFIYCTWASTTSKITSSAAAASPSSSTTTTTSSADADNGLDTFSGQSRSTNMVPFWVHCDFSLSMWSAPTDSLRHFHSSSVL